MPSSDPSSPPRAPLVPEPDKVAHARRERPRNTSGTAVPGRDATPPLTVAISDRERLRAMTTSSRGGREPSTARSRRPITRREHVARQRRCSSRVRRPRAGAGAASSSTRPSGRVDYCVEDRAVDWWSHSAAFSLRAPPERRGDGEASSTSTSGACRRDIGTDNPARRQRALLHPSLRPTSASFFRHRRGATPRRRHGRPLRWPREPVGRAGERRRSAIAAAP